MAELLSAVALVLGLLGAAPSAIAAQEGLTVGEMAGPVVLETLEGDPVDLADVIGEKPVLIEFWATWCAVCRALEPALRAAHEAHGEDVEFLIVAAAVGQSRDAVRLHLDRHPPAGRVLWDTEGRFTRGFDAPGTGYVVVLDSEGRVSYTGTGPSQDLTAAVRKVAGDG